MRSPEPAGPEQLKQFIRDALQSAADDGYEPPYYLAVVGINGETIVMQFDYQEETDNFKARTLCEASPDGLMMLPINGMLVDSQGRASHLRIDGPEASS
jgi:hypothetical protein